MKNFIVRDSYGAILRRGRCPESLLLAQAGPGEVAEENAGGLNEVEHYFDGVGYANKVPVPAVFGGASIAADGVDVAAITGLPVGTVVEYATGVPGETDIANVDDGVFNYSIDVPGTFDLIFIHRAHSDLLIQVVAV